MSERREVRSWTVSEPPEVTLSGDVAQLRAAIESLFPAAEGYTEAFDELVERGLLVEVPADEEYRDQWESETMWVWRWRVQGDSGG